MTFVLACGWMALVLVAAVGARLLPLPDPNEIDPRNALLPPGTGHLLGTDGLGRDQLSRIVHGAQVSMIVSVTAVLVGAVIGGLLGVVAGYLRGRTEGVVLAISDVVLAFPGLVLLLVLLAYVGRSLVAISLIIGLLSVPLYARVARANTMSVTERDYVRAAGVLGATRVRIVLREILPNIVLPLTAYAFVALGRVIVLEGSLAFLGLSVKPPDATWGQMIADSKRHLDETLWPVIVPCSVMFLTVLSLSLIGDRLRGRIDVRGEAQ
jgi:peptide/nickel transport system permease protein